MQKNAKKKNDLKPVYKPYLQGKPVSKLAAKRGVRVIGYVVLFTFLYVLVGTALTFDNTFLRVALNLALVAAAAFMMMNDGANQGVNDVAFAEIAQNRVNEGKNVASSDQERCYHPLKGFFTVLIGISPVLLVAVVFSIVAQKQTYILGPLPSWVEAYSGYAEVGQALAYYNEPVGLTLEGVLRVVMRMINFPFVNMGSPSDYSAMYLLDKLSPLLCLIAPLFYALGYLRGPHLRALVHGNIRMNRRRHNRNERKAREKRAMQMKQKEKKELI